MRAGHPTRMRLRERPALTAATLAALAIAAVTAAADGPSVQDLERRFADFLDARGAVNAISTGLLAEVDGRTGEAWRSELERARDEVAAGLGALSIERLAPADVRLARAMRLTFEELSDADDLAPATCRDAPRERTLAALQSALYACFDEVGNHLEFEGRPLTRGGALQLLQEIDEPRRRRALFLAMAPLWEAIDGAGGDSPYRRMIRLAVEDYRSRESPIAAAARALGTDVASLERWLVELLEAWRRVSVEPGRYIEPWDYRFRFAGASRELDAAIPHASLETLNRRFFADLGADPNALGVHFDLAPRPGKDPVAYADTVLIGRTLNGRWRPAVSRISASYDRGGLYTLNELLHETGHAVHYAAIRARPALFWPDTLLIEAFADVPSWSVHEPEWQRKYLGRAVPRADALRERYALVMLDVAWGLFELRMLRDPSTDPDALWTEITSRHLGIAPHPEWSWWAVRGQLVSSPGYMINYAVGAILTAEMRARTREAIGPFDAGNERWYAWLSEKLLRHGAEMETHALLEFFLGRPPSPAALIRDIESIGPGDADRRMDPASRN